MRTEDVLAFVNENPICTIATIDGDQPRVRAFLSILFDDKNIYFTTGAMKNFWKQVAANPHVELCYLASDFSRMLRITGEIEEVDDRSRKQRLIDEREYLKGFSADDLNFKLIKIKNGKARFWTLADNLKEAEAETVAI